MKMITDKFEDIFNRYLNDNWDELVWKEKMRYIRDFYYEIRKIDKEPMPTQKELKGILNKIFGKPLTRKNKVRK